jgi:D-lactate dehydrogenase (cytochrome)
VRKETAVSAAPVSRTCPRIEGADAIGEQCADVLSDESKLAAASVDRVYFPESVDDVVAAVTELAAARRRFTVSAARTGIVGGAVPMDARSVVSLHKMTAVVGVAFDRALGRPIVKVQAGLSLDALAAHLDAFDFSTLGGDAGRKAWYYPIDPTERSATIGGTIATNASGARSFHYGPTRASVHGLTVILADGRRFSIRRGEVCAKDSQLRWSAAFGEKVFLLPRLARPSCKCAAGFDVSPGVDLVDMFVGSEGTLGIIAEAELLLSEKPPGVLALLCFLPPAADAFALVKALRSSAGLSPLSIEYFAPSALGLLREEREHGDDKIPEIPASAGSAVFFEQPYRTDDELDAYVGTIDETLSLHGGSIDDTWAGEDAAEREKMRVLRHSVPEAVNNRIARRKRQIPELHKVGTDLSVCDEAFDELAKAYLEDVPASGLEHVIFGHIGENHLHVNLVPRSREELDRAKALHRGLARRAVALGGSVTAEHGIGRLKRDLLQIQYGAQGVAALRAVKDAFDPNGLLNPGVLFEARG